MTLKNGVLNLVLSIVLIVFMLCAATSQAHAVWDIGYLYTQGTIVGVHESDGSCLYEVEYEIDGTLYTVSLSLEGPHELGESTTIEYDSKLPHMGHAPIVDVSDTHPINDGATTAVLLVAIIFVISLGVVIASVGITFWVLRLSRGEGLNTKAPRKNKESHSRGCGDEYHNKISTDNREPWERTPKRRD